MICRFCKKEVPDNAEFCPHCGKEHITASEAAAKLLFNDADEIFASRIDEEDTIEEMPQA